MKKLFTPEDISGFSYLSWPAISEQGTLISCVVKESDEKSGDHIPYVLVFEKAEDGFFRELPDFRIPNAEQPVFLKDGRSLSVLSSESGEKQVWIYRIPDGQKKQVTTLRHGVSDYRISPDEDQICFSAVLWPEEVKAGLSFTEMNPEEKAAWTEELDETPYATEKLTYKLDEWYGMRKGEFSHIGICRVDGASKVILDLQGHEAFTPGWNHAGTEIAFYGEPYDGARGFQKEVFIAKADGSEVRRITDDFSAHDSHAPIFTTDDRAVISFTFPNFSDYSSVLTPYRISLSDGTRKPLTDEWDEAAAFGAELFIAGRTENGQNKSNAYLSVDGTYLYFLSGLRGHTGIYRVNISEAEVQPIQPVLMGDTDIQGFCLDAWDNPVILQGTVRYPAELFYKGQQLTDRNGWLREYEFPEVTEHTVRSDDGKELLQYYLWHPVNQEAGKQYPAVLDIKGGPETMYSACYWHEFHALTSAGFAVIAPNPRGSIGFGRSYMADAVCWRQEVVSDMERFVKDAVSLGFIDETRVGVTGGSYGGYMTNKLMGRSELFSAAVTQRSLVNPVTSYGTGDMGFISSRPVPADFSMKTYLEDRAKDNIITYIDHFKIPLLILHAGRDYRCTFEQAEQLFVAMRERNPEVPVRMIRFPLENHSLTRTGKLYNQIRHLREMTDWFTRYLSGKEEAHD